MKTKRHLRLLGFAAAAGVPMVTLACINLTCIDRPIKEANPVPCCVPSVLSIPQSAESAERDVDILFVIDNSGSMGGEQALLQSQFIALMTELENLTGGLPNVHLGVTSTDLGTGQFAYTYCDNPPTGDEGHLLTWDCTYPEGAHYIVDVAPKGCEAKPNVQGICTDYDGSCTQASCSHEPSTTLVIDPFTGCPRCRNYGDQTLGDTFKCIASLGIMGCGFEQPLEAMYKALDPNNWHNEGFLREEAFLAVIFITDEDDCSASTPQIFDNTQTDINSPLGPATSYRCFEFGITCDVNSRTAQGERRNCVPREDQGALLYPVSRYVDFLRQLKDPQMLVVAAIAGPTSGGTAFVALNDQGQPELQPSCITAEDDGAVPAFRIESLVKAFNQPEDMGWAFSSICAANYRDALQGIGARIKGLLDFQCLPAPLQGCRDVGAEFTVGHQDNCPDNDKCLPNCIVTDVFKRGLPDETRREVLPCLEVCPSGPCPGNTDRSQAYADAHPSERDPNLPVEACWHINYQENCPDSNYSGILISRQTDPPARSFAEVACVQIPLHEELCTDGQDNDEDCLIDEEDPDCQ